MDPIDSRPDFWEFNRHVFQYAIPDSRSPVDCLRETVACQIAVNDIAPSPETLGELNAIVLAISSGLRAVVPAIATSIYGAGIKSQILYGHLFWVLIIGLAIGLYFILLLLPEKAGGRYHSEESEDA